jgi:hypothetical protein
MLVIEVLRGNSSANLRMCTRYSIFTTPRVSPGKGAAQGAKNQIRKIAKGSAS